MDEFRFVPLDRCEVVPARVESVVELLRDPARLERAEAFVLVREEAWAAAPLYYVFDREELESVLRSTGAADELTRDRLFELLDIHEPTRADEVHAADAVHRRAVVLDDGEALAGAWVQLQAPVMRNGDAAPAPPPAAAPPPPPAPAPPPPPAEPPSFSLPPPPVAANGDEAEDEERRDGAEPAADAFFRRTPHLDVRDAEAGPLLLGQRFTATVFLDTGAARPGETVQEVVIDLPDELEILDIDVLLAGTEHFAVTGECMKTLSMHRDDARSPDLTFELEVVAAGPTAGAAALTAYLTYLHRPCGRVHRTVALQGVATPAEPAAEAIEPVRPAELAIDARAEPADLTVDIVRTPDNDGRHFLVTVRTTLVDDFAMTEPEPWNFPQDTDAYVAGMMAQFTLKGATPFARQASLKGAGTQLWTTAPQSFRDLFWRLLDEGQPLRTIFVASEEPNIPWELMRPRRELPNGELEQREALGVEFVIGRWVHPGHRSPKQQAPIEDSYVVAPEYPVRPLKTSADEAAWVCERFAGVTVTPAEQARLDEMLSDRPVGLLHFVAHGKSDPQTPQILMLENEAVFNALQVKGMEGLERACRAKAPLVFLNACEVGRTTPSLVGAGGFAGEFVTAGARCVIAPLWSVKDSLAHDVAKDFYTAALERPTRPLADILRDIRARSYEEGGGEDTYAAYCFYGDPLTTLEQ